MYIGIVFIAVRHSKNIPFEKSFQIIREMSIMKEIKRCDYLIEQARELKISLKNTNEFMETNDDAKKLVADLQNHLRDLFKLKYGNDIKTFQSSLRIIYLNSIIICISTFS